MTTLFKQFFDRNTMYALIGIGVFHAIAWLVQHSVWSAIPFVLLVLSVGVITSRSLVWGLALAMLEIFIGGHGHIIDVSLGGTMVGIRMGIFAAVMVGTAYHMVMKRVMPRIVPERDVPFLLLVAAVALGSITGFANNRFMDAFDDMNGYVTFAYMIPVAMIVWTPAAKRVMLWTLALSSAWVAGSSLALMFVFTHFPVEWLWAVYTFVRDARIAEATLLSGPSWLVSMLPNGPWYFRIFAQGQFVVMIFTVLLASGAGFLRVSFGKASALIVLLSVLFAVDIGGQSRSFWIGLCAGGVLLAGALIMDRIKVREIVGLKTVGIVSLVLAIIGLWVVVVFPLPQRPDLTQTPYYRGANDDTRGLAVSSRWNLLGPMMENIALHPVVGNGFGTSVTYTSDDPRIRATHAEGQWTTYRFEWGYHDIWLKMGIPGLLAFLWYLAVVLRAGFRSMADQDASRWIAVGLACGIVALYATHTFSPYLNHPIGLGFMVFVMPFLPWRSKIRATDPVPVRPRMAPISSLSPTPTLRNR